MLASAGAFKGKRTADELVVQGFSNFALMGQVGVNQVAEVKIAVAHMTNDEVRNAAGISLGH